MRVRFRVNLGIIDAKTVNAKTGSQVNWAECKIGAELNLSDSAAKWLLDRGIVEACESPVRGVAKPSKITAPASNE
jgi:hypothetical protein